MKKTKFSIDIKRSGSFNDGFIRMITNHNEGHITITIDAFEMLAKTQCFQWPTIYPDWEIVSLTGSPHYIEVFENNKLTVSIMEKEIYEIENTVIKGEELNES